MSDINPAWESQPYPNLVVTQSGNNPTTYHIGPRINPAWLHCRTGIFIPGSTCVEDDISAWRHERISMAKSLKDLSKADRRKVWWKHILKRRMEAI